MLVKVSERYKGVYGCFDATLNTVSAKRAGDPPFNVPAEIAQRHIQNGVLVAVDGAETSVMTAEKVPEPKAVSQHPVKEEKPFEKMSFPELKDAAKTRGINHVGKKKSALIALMKEYDAQTPNLSAEDPV